MKTNIAFYISLNFFSMRNVSDNCCRENQNTFYVEQRFFRKSAIHEVMWKNMVKQERPQMTIWPMRIACWILKARNTH
jgi:hypothetical protein